MLLCKDFQVSSLIAFSQFSLLLQKQSLSVASLRSWPSEFQLHCSAVSYVLHETGNGDWPHFPQRSDMFRSSEIQLCRLFCRMHTYRLATDEQCRVFTKSTNWHGCYSCAQAYSARLTIGSPSRVMLLLDHASITHETIDKFGNVKNFKRHNKIKLADAKL